MNKILICILIFGLLIDNIEMFATERSENNETEIENHQKLLSRRRRYLTFPEGSSLQLGE